MAPTLPCPGQCPWRTRRSQPVQQRGPREAKLVTRFGIVGIELCLIDPQMRRAGQCDGRLRTEAFSDGLKQPCWQTGVHADAEVSRCARYHAKRANWHERECHKHNGDYRKTWRILFGLDLNNPNIRAFSFSGTRSTDDGVRLRALARVPPNNRRPKQWRWA